MTSRLKASNLPILILTIRISLLKSCLNLHLHFLGWGFGNFKDGAEYRLIKQAAVARQGQVPHQIG